VRVTAEPATPGSPPSEAATAEPPTPAADPSAPASPALSAEDIESAVERSKRAGWAWGDEAAEIPADAALAELLPLAARTMGTFWGQTVQGTGISGAGLAVLRVLAARNGLKSSEVAARGWSTPGTVTTVVDTLVRDGLVRRERDFQDRRVVRLFVTERGMDKLIETLAEVGPRWRACFDYVDPADEPVIRQFLIDTIERFSTLIRKERGS
jgi:DNA-binding MarR family transcriptional regulator